MADIITDTLRELRADNSFYKDFVFDKARSFLIDLYADKSIAPNGSHSVRQGLLYAAAQGFVTGYGAAIDGDFSEDNAALPAKAVDDAQFKLVIDMLDGLSEWQTARIGAFAETLIGAEVPDPLRYFAVYGFASGFKQGLGELESGEAKYWAEPDEEHDKKVKSFMGAAFEEHSDDYVPYIWAMCGARDLEDDNIDDLVDKVSDELVAYLMEQAPKSYLADGQRVYSGYASHDDKWEASAISLYAEHFLMGFFDAKTGELDEPGMLEEPYGFGEASIPYNPIENIAHSYMKNGVDGKYSELACVHMQFEYELLEDCEDEMPEDGSPFWVLIGRGYADGARVAEGFAHEVDFKLLDRFTEDMKVWDHISSLPPDMPVNFDPSMFDGRASDIGHVQSLLDGLADMGYVAVDAKVSVSDEDIDLVGIFEDVLEATQEPISAMSQLNSLCLKVVPNKDSAMAFDRYYSSFCAEYPEAAIAIAHNWEFQGGCRMLRVIEAYKKGEEPPCDVVMMVPPRDDWYEDDWDEDDE